MRTKKIGPRLLIAIPISRTYDYGEREKDAPRFTGDRLTAIRETWLKDVAAAGAEYKLFVGSTQNEYKCTQIANDEVQLACSDRYEDLPQKTQAICRWALERGYDYIYRTDDDSFAHVNRLMASGFDTHDYSGYCIDYPPHHERHRYSGAPGFFLSQRAMELVAANTPDHHADDLWIGRVLYEHGIKVHRDTRHVPGFQAHYVDLDALPASHPYIAFHSVRPEDMYRLHANPVSAETVAPAKTFQEPSYNFNYGRRDASCPCNWCQETQWESQTS